MATTKAGQRAVAKYMKNNYDDIKVRVTKGKREVLQEIADAQGESVNSYIKKAISARIKNETGKDIEL